MLDHTKPYVEKYTI